LDLDSIEVHERTVIVYLHATYNTAACSQCGTAGSRIHSRYSRTIADLAFGGRNLVLRLLVRKWICPEASCSRHIFAECFPEVVQRYARMTDRLIKALQAVGAITNGADAAQIASSFGVHTTAKTIIRRVLQLPLPSEGSVHKVGIDEWAWKKGHRYGTILERRSRNETDEIDRTSWGWLAQEKGSAKEGIRRKSMQPETWKPPVELSQQEEQIVKKIRKAKLFVFLRRHRHELLDEPFQQELASLYRKAERGQPPVAPAMLALALILQAYTGVSDDEVIEATVMDRRWQLVLDCVDSDEAPFSKGTLVAFRQRLIEAHMD
jgi:Transposase domain (DUF772)/zinc-finger of transposase IS204/IS1001/IS1096/IS1165